MSIATGAMAIGELVPGMDDSGSSFTFHAIETAFPSLQTTQMRDCLLKWNLQPTMVAKAFRFDQAFKPQQLDAFLLDFFNDPEVQEHAPVALPGGNWGQLGKATAVKKERLAATLLRLDLFDQLDATEIVRSGSISGCLDAQVGEILVSDRWPSGRSSRPTATVRRLQAGRAGKPPPAAACLLPLQRPGFPSLIRPSGWQLPPQNGTRRLSSPQLATGCHPLRSWQRLGLLALASPYHARFHARCHARCHAR